MDFICVCVRIPKCGSTSLAGMLDAAFSTRRTFYVPHTLDLDGPCSPFQQIRFLRSRARNLFCRYRTTSIRKTFAIIAERAVAGDLINGGHIDFPSVRDNLNRAVKMVALLRDPAARCRSEYDYCRASYLNRGVLERVDSGVRHKAAAKYDFDGFLDFLLEHRVHYGDIAARYIGWDGTEDLAAFFAANVFHSGILENTVAFERGLSEKMGMTLRFPHHNGGPGDRDAVAITAAQRQRIERIYPRDYTLHAFLAARA